MGRKEKFFRAYYIQNTHQDTHQNYIYNIHLEITFPTHIRITLDCPIHLLAHRSLIYSLIYRTTQNSTHFIYIQNIHQNYIRITIHLPPPCPCPHTPIIITFLTYIPTYIRITLDLPTRSFACLLHHLLCAHPQTFYHIIITFRTYIQNYILTHIITTL